jgi:hypothetical protein
MALLRDEGWLRLADLERYESGIGETMRLEGIGWESKASVGLEEVERRLSDHLRQEFRDIDGNQQLDHVRVSNALRHWVAMATLHLVFEDAYSQQLNDRYRYKRDRYQDKTRDAENEYFRAGVEYVWRPIKKAFAPEASEQLMSGFAGGQIYLAVTNVDGDCEGAPSEPTAFDLSAGSTVMLRMPLAERAMHWHVYAGRSAKQMSRQTDEPLDPEANFIWNGDLLLGPALKDGQERDTLLTTWGRIRRG